MGPRILIVIANHLSSVHHHEVMLASYNNMNAVEHHSWNTSVRGDMFKCVCDIWTSPCVPVEEVSANIGRYYTAIG